MQGDFTRDTFKPEKHYEQVLMQQGRVQVDADWNEQTAIAARRDATMLADLAGHCGGPAEAAAFAIIGESGKLIDMPADPGTPIRQFGLSAGRYYVDGLQCEVEEPFLFSWQPDHRQSSALPPGRHLLYLDVWQRHLTVLDAVAIRELALGGPDTATRVKTVWQVRAIPTTAVNCADAAGDLAGLTRADLPQLKARTALADADSDPCALPASAGYRGLENQLYRVEIHDGSCDEMDKPQTPTFKWSRENGSVVTAVTDFRVGAAGTVLTVEGIGPDDVLGFKSGDLVELLDDSYELEGLPGKLAAIDGNPEKNAIRLKVVPGYPLPTPTDLDLNRHPKLRRWEGVARVARPEKNGGYLKLERGIEIRFDADGDGYRSGDYWLAPARTATADATTGDIEWPRELNSLGKPIPLPQSPRGVVHHYCRLGVITVKPDGTLDDTATQDCRCLWPALTSVPRLFYVSGDGQEVMPDLTAPGITRFKLPRPLIVGVANAHCLDRAVSVRFRVEEPSKGFVVAAGGSPTKTIAEVPLDSEGLAKCDFYLDGANANQQVTSRLLDAAGDPVSLPVIFNANLSIASQVAFQPGNCAGLAGQKNVQDAISQLADMASIYKLSGDGQQAAAGAKLKEQLRVLVANRCGPVAKVPVSFQVILGGGSVSPKTSATGEDGEVTCDWQLGGDSVIQVVEATVADATQPTTEPRRVHFIAHLTGEGSNDPEPVRIVGLRFGKPVQVLTNGQTLTPSDLQAGLFLLCDQVIDPGTVVDPINSGDDVIVRGQPTCFVTVEVPYPLSRIEKSMWDLNGMAGYRPTILHGQVSSAELRDGRIEPPLPPDIQARGVITWQARGATIEFLSRVLNMLNDTKPRPDKVLARLTLKGNFIWSEDATKLFKRGTPGGFLDGDSFRAPRQVGESELLLPSGDKRRGGDFEMWFWLTAAPD